MSWMNCPSCRVYSCLSSTVILGSTLPLTQGICVSLSLISSSKDGLQANVTSLAPCASVSELSRIWPPIFDGRSLGPENADSVTFFRSSAECLLNLRLLRPRILGFSGRVTRRSELFSADCSRDCSVATFCE